MTLITWADYPKKIGKGDAAKVWKTMRPSADLQSRIREAVASQRTCRQWMKDGGQYIPMPSTWLRQKRWDDAPEPDVPVQAAVATRTSAAQMPAYNPDWCQHEPRCNSRDWHDVLVGREQKQERA